MGICIVIIHGGVGGWVEARRFGIIYLFGEVWPAGKSESDCLLACLPWIDV